MGGGDSGAKKAAKIQAQASREAVAEQRRQFAITQENLKPITDQLAPAISAESALLGLSGAQAQQQALDEFSESPGQKFLRERAERGLLRNQAAIGGLGGGNVRQALQEQAAGFASQALGQQLDRLASVRTGGQSGALSLGGLGQQAATNIGAGLQNAAAAQASGILAQQSGGGLGSALGGAASGALAGAQIGSIVPGVGTGIGAGVGAALGGLSGLLG